MANKLTINNLPIENIVRKPTLISIGAFDTLFASLVSTLNSVVQFKMTP